MDKIKDELNVWFKKGLAVEENHPEEAIKYYNSIIEHSENYLSIQKITMEAYHKKSLLLKKLEKPEESSELLDKAKTLWRQWEENKVKNEEELYKIRYDIAFRLLMEGKYQESVECFDGLLNIKPNDATVLSNKGIAFLAISESDDDNLVDGYSSIESLQEYAIDCFDESLSIEPNNDVALYNKSRIFVFQSAEEDDEEEKHVLNSQALECLNKALEVNPNSARTNFAKALVLIDLDRMKESVEFMDNALEIEPNNEIFLDFKGGTVVQLGMLEESVECFEKLIQIDPNNLKAWYNKGVSLLSQVNPYPSNPTLDDKSKLDDSIKCMERAIEIDPNCAAAWYNKGTSCIVAGRIEESVTCLDKALEIDPDFLGKVKQSAV